MNKFFNKLDISLPEERLSVSQDGLFSLELCIVS